MTVKIAYDAGHGMYTPGKRCDKRLDENETREWVLNERIVSLVERELLKSYTGFEFMRLDDRTGKTDISLSIRVNKANRWGADVVISVHHNAGAKLTNAGGITAHIAKVSSSKSKVYQKDLYDSLIKHTWLKGNRSNPLSRDNFYIVRYTKAPAVLIEHGFMDSKIDTPIILKDYFAMRCANAHVEFLAKTFNLKKKTPIKELTYEDSLNILLKHGVIKSPDYWRECGRTTYHIKELIISMAEVLVKK